MTSAGTGGSFFFIGSPNRSGETLCTVLFADAGSCLHSALIPSTAERVAASKTYSLFFNRNMIENIGCREKQHRLKRKWSSRVDGEINASCRLRCLHRVLQRFPKKPSALILYVTHIRKLLFET